MKKAAGITLLFILVVFLGFFVSKITYEPIDTLIKPPQIEGENADIQLAFENSVGKNYILKTPLEGDHRSSFIRIDIDHDESDEVIVLYSLSESVDVVRMHILDKLNDKWNTVVDLESAYDGIQQISFADINNDNTSEIIVCWRSFTNEISKTLDVYKMLNINGEKTLECIFTKKYNEFLLCDINKDNKTDLLIFEKINNNASSEIKGIFYNFTDNTAGIRGEFTLDPAIAAIGAVSFDNGINNNQTRIYVDGYKTDTGLTTELVCWDDHEGGFVKQTDNNYSPISSVTSRSVNICCKDINKDKLIEIPIEGTLPLSKVITENDYEGAAQSIVKWMQYDGYDLIFNQYEILNTEYGYSIRLDAEMFNSFTVLNNITNGTLTFYQLIEDNNPDNDKRPKKKDEQEKNIRYPDNQREYVVGERLFSIIAVNDQDYGLYEFSGYRFLTSDNGYSYYCRIYDAAKDLKISKETIKSIIIT